MTMRMSSTPGLGCPPWEISEAKHIVDVGCVRFNVSHVIVDVVATVDDRNDGFVAVLAQVVVEKL